MNHYCKCCAQLQGVELRLWLEQWGYAESDKRGESVTKIERAVIVKAVQWFNSHRPVGFSQNQHLINPRINQVFSSSGQHLAEAVARYINTQKKKNPA